MSTLIIQSPHNQGTLRKYTQSSMTMALWALWFYLLLPILAPVLILIGNDIHTVSQIEHPVNITQFVAVLLLIITMIPGYWLWGKYNTLLHNRRNKKAHKNNTHQHESLNYFSVPAKELFYWQQLKQATVELTEQGDISCVQEHKQLKKPC